jgi:hypothetical protein
LFVSRAIVDNPCCIVASCDAHDVSFDLVTVKRGFLNPVVSQVMERLRDRLNHIAAASPPISASFARSVTTPSNGNGNGATRAGSRSPPMSAPMITGSSSGSNGNGYHDRRPSSDSLVNDGNGGTVATVDDDWSQLKHELRSSRGPSSSFPLSSDRGASLRHGASGSVRSAERSVERATQSAETAEAVAEAKWLRSNADVAARAMQQRYQADLQVYFPYPYHTIPE